MESKQITIRQLSLQLFLTISSSSMAWAKKNQAQPAFEPISSGRRSSNGNHAAVDDKAHETIEIDDASEVSDKIQK